MAEELKWSELKGALRKEFAFGKKELDHIRDGLLEAGDRISLVDLVDLISSAGASRKEVADFLKKKFEITEDEVKLRVGTYTLLDLSEPEGIKNCQKFLNVRLKEWKVEFEPLKENGELDAKTQAAIGKLKEYTRSKLPPSLRKRNVPVWVVSEKMGMMLTTGTYSPDRLEEYGEKTKDGNMVVVNLAFHTLGDLEASKLNKAVKLPVSGNTKKLQLLFDDFEIIGKNGLPVLWNRERGFGAVPYPYRVTEEEQKAKKTGVNFIPDSHEAVDIALGTRKVKMFAPFAGYVVRANSNDFSYNGGSVVIRGFLKGRESGKYEEVRLIVYHLDRQKVAEGSYIDIGQELGTGHFIPPPKANGYFCIAVEVSGKRVPITDLIKAGREFVPLSDLQKLPKSLVEEGVLSIQAPKEQKLKQMR